MIERASEVAILAAREWRPWFPVHPTEIEDIILFAASRGVGREGIMTALRALPFDIFDEDLFEKHPDFDEEFRAYNL